MAVQIPALGCVRMVTGICPKESSLTTSPHLAVACQIVLEALVLYLHRVFKGCCMVVLHGGCLICNLWLENSGVGDEWAMLMAAAC